jgi:tetraacyldisaccharide 4'-kinase
MWSAGAFFNRVWYEGSVWSRLLSPLAGLFAWLVGARQGLYRSAILKSRRAPVPVVVVGNITVGGTGKTPVTLWLAERLKERGFKPGIASRGYGGRTGSAPLHVNDASDAASVGDEPLLLARRVVCPVVVHPDRAAAAGLLAAMGCDVVLLDDGLQHYRLERDFEIAVVDGARGFGNGRMLPAGPLREPVSRLDSVHRILLKQPGGAAHEVLAPLAARVTPFRLTVRDVQSLHGGRRMAIDEFAGRRVHAVAGIADPESFFNLLRAHGIDVLPHPFPDHARIADSDLAFGDDRPVLMTEKDAVRSERVAPAHSWRVAVDVAIGSDADLAWLEELASRLRAPAEQGA